MNDKKNTVLFFVLLLSLLHLSTLCLPSVNLEFAFSDAVTYFESGNKHLLDQYFSYQANTLAFPYLAYLIHILIPGIKPLFILRGLSTFGLLLLGISIRRISVYLGFSFGLGFYLVILLNPLIWTYAGRGTADVFPVALGIFAISMVLKKEGGVLLDIFSGLLLGFSCILKYHALGLLPVLFFMRYSKNGLHDAFITTVRMGAVAVFVLIGFVFVQYENYHFLLTPSRYQEIHSLHVDNFINNLLGYFGFVTLLAVPFIFFSAGMRKRARKSVGVISLLASFSFIFGYLFLKNTGELNFGPLDRWISPAFGMGLLLLFVFTGCVSIYFQIRGSEKKFIFFGIFLLIFALSLSRPSQRYLIYVLPFFMMLISRENFENKIILVPTLCVLVIANIFVPYSQWSTGEASKEMVGVLIQRGLLSKTDPGDIDSHVGNLFWNVDRGLTVYKVVAGKVAGAEVVVTSPISFAAKSYSLVRTGPKG